jgi:DNA processing protein
MITQEALSLHCFNTFPHIGAKTLARIHQKGASRLWQNGTYEEFVSLIRGKDVTWYSTWQKLDKDQYLAQEKAYLESQNISIIIIGDTDYPYRLAEIANPPTILYVQGDISGLDNALAIIGTRKYSPYGARITEKISKELSEAGIPIISGLALGIDGIAHRGCLAGNSKTIAVLGGGLDMSALYPKSHKSLAKTILQSGGALISESAPHKQPRPESFILRNRIVSGLSRGILVIEAPYKSGTMATVKFGLEQNRDIFAIPGNIDVKNSEGTNYLIQEGATLVTKAQDVLDTFGLEMIVPTYSLDRFAPEQQDIIQYLSKQPMTIEQLAQHSNREVLEIMTILSILELSGIVSSTQLGEYHLTIDIQI